MGFIDDNEQKRIISENLVSYIILSGKEQKDIAIELDVNPPTFNQWVNGKAVPSVTMLKRLAAYFGVPLTGIVDKNGLKSNDLELTASEIDIIKAYRKAGKGIKDAINKLLDI